MGEMTLKEFREDVAGGLQRGTPDAIGKPRLDRWIHNAMYEFGYALKFRELEGSAQQTIVAGTNTLEVPTRFRMLHTAGLELLGVERFEGRMVKEDRDEFIKYNRTVNSFNFRGRPKYYHIYGSEFIVRPTPDVDFDVLVHYWMKIRKLVDEADTSVFGADWDDIILTGALYRGFRHYNEFDRYQNVRADFLGLVRSRATEEDLEAFPEGGIQPVDWTQREDQTYYGNGEPDRSYGETHP